MHDAIDDFTLPDDDEVERVVDTLRLLSDPTRLRILWAMLQGESSVACLAEVATVSPTVVSQHLSKLRLAGVVRARQEGTYRYYAVVSAEVADLLRTLFTPVVESGGPAGNGRRAVPVGPQRTVMPGPQSRR